MGGGDSRECDGDLWVEGTAGSVMVTSGWRGQQGV